MRWLTSFTLHFLLIADFNFIVQKHKRANLIGFINELGNQLVYLFRVKVIKLFISKWLQSKVTKTE